MKRKNKEVGKCKMCGKETRKFVQFSRRLKTFYCGCQGVRCGVGKADRDEND